jgi:Domain of unknown function (DUF1971)
MSGKIPYKGPPVFDENALPVALRTEHRTKSGVWGSFGCPIRSPRRSLMPGIQDWCSLTSLTWSRRSGLCECRSSSTTTCQRCRAGSEVPPSRLRRFRTLSARCAFRRGIPSVGSSSGALAVESKNPRPFLRMDRMRARAARDPVYRRRRFSPETICFKTGGQRIELLVRGS